MRRATEGRASYNCGGAAARCAEGDRREPFAQRKRLCAGWEIAFRLPITEFDVCNIVDVLFNCQIYNVLLELKPNSSKMLRFLSVCPTCTKPHVGCRKSYLSLFQNFLNNSMPLKSLTELFCRFGSSRSVILKSPFFRKVIS